MLILHEGTLFGGSGGEISEHCFTLLDAPPVRCGSMETPIPFALELEAQFMAKQHLDGTIQKLLSF